jgi:hypothetical protein
MRWRPFIFYLATFLSIGIANVILLVVRPSSPSVLSVPEMMFVSLGLAILNELSEINSSLIPNQLETGTDKALMMNAY